MHAGGAFSGTKSFNHSSGTNRRIFFRQSKYKGMQQELFGTIQQQVSAKALAQGTVIINN